MVRLFNILKLHRLPLYLTVKEFESQVLDNTSRKRKRRAVWVLVCEKWLSKDTNSRLTLLPRVKFTSPFNLCKLVCQFFLTWQRTWRTFNSRHLGYKVRAHRKLVIVRLEAYLNFTDANWFNQLERQCDLGSVTLIWHCHRSRMLSETSIMP